MFCWHFLIDMTRDAKYSLQIREEYFRTNQPPLVYHPAPVTLIVMENYDTYSREGWEGASRNEQASDAVEIAADPSRVELCHN